MPESTIPTGESPQEEFLTWDRPTIETRLSAYQPDSILVDELHYSPEEQTGYSRLTVTDQQCHYLKPETGLAVLPPAQTIEAATQTLGLIAMASSNETRTELVIAYQGAEHTDLEVMVKPQNILYIYADIEKESPLGNGTIYEGDVTVTLGKQGMEVARILGLKIIIVPISS